MNEHANLIDRMSRRQAAMGPWSIGEVVQRKNCKSCRRALAFGRAEISRSAQGRNQEILRLRTGAYMNDATAMLAAIRSGDAQATEQLLVLVYDELRRL